MAKDEKLTEALYLRIAPDDIRRLDALAERIPVVSRNGIARAAMRLGLAALDADPRRILEGGPPAKRGRRSAGGRRRSRSR